MSALLQSCVIILIILQVDSIAFIQTICFCKTHHISELCVCT